MADLQRVPLEVKTDLSTTAKGGDSGALIVSSTGVLLFSGALGLIAHGLPIVFAPLVYSGGLAGIGLAIAGARGWYKGRHRRDLDDAPQTEIYVKGDEVSVKSNRINNNRELTRLLVGVLQGRKELPAPYGQAGAVPRAYSEAEKARFLEEQRQREADHDAGLVAGVSQPAISASSDAQAGPAGPSSSTLVGSLRQDLTKPNPK
jgi:hypothetical protein